MTSLTELEFGTGHMRPVVPDAQPTRRTAHVRKCDFRPNSRLAQDWSHLCLRALADSDAVNAVGLLGNLVINGACDSAPDNQVPNGTACRLNHAARQPLDRPARPAVTEFDTPAARPGLTPRAR